MPETLHGLSADTRPELEAAVTVYAYTLEAARMIVACRVAGETIIVACRARRGKP